MGEDFIRRTRQAYRRLLQDSTRELRPSPLFLRDEEETTLYPCQLLTNDIPLSPGKRLLLLRHSKMSRVAVLDGNHVIGAVSGEAVKELRQLFERHGRGAPDAISVQVASTTPGSVQFEVSLVGRKAKRKVK